MTDDQPHRQAAEAPRPVATTYMTSQGPVDEAPPVPRAPEPEDEAALPVQADTAAETPATPRARPVRATSKEQ